MKRSFALGLLLAAIAVGSAWDAPKPAATPAENLAQNPDFLKAGANAKPANYELKGDAYWTEAGRWDEFAPRGVALDTARDLDGDGTLSGLVAQTVTGIDGTKERWFRFSFRGLPDDDFRVTNDDLAMKVDFFSHGGTRPLDGVSRKIYPLIERDRKALAVNGNGNVHGAAVWKTYALEFKLPFPEIDALRLSVAFRNGVATAKKEAAFSVSEFRLVPMAPPVEGPKPTKPGAAPANLVPLGGRWYRHPDAKDEFTSANAEQLYYRDDRLSNPFAQNMAAWLRRGYLNRAGLVVDEDKFVPDSVTVRFEDGKTLVVRTKGLPNHPTAMFPSPARATTRDPNYIQEQDATFYVPLDPKKNPNAVAMDKANSNRGLPMGAIGFAVNGVVFFNPFDADRQDAHDIMDRCCGHPSPSYQYHYHKYPVCVKSPFVDDGEEHSPLIGWAFDGFPIYGPYEAKGAMAKDSTDNPLNEFNVHFDGVRGWHYHVTPGKFPYVIGGYWGEVDPRNTRRGPKR